jgi:hypothetical protein
VHPSLEALAEEALHMPRQVALSLEEYEHGAPVVEHEVADVDAACTRRLDQPVTERRREARARGPRCDVDEPWIKMALGVGQSPHPAAKLPEADDAAGRQEACAPAAQDRCAWCRSWCELEATRGTWSHQRHVSENKGAGRRLETHLLAFLQPSVAGSHPAAPTQLRGSQALPVASRGRHRPLDGPDPGAGRRVMSPGP